MDGRPLVEPSYEWQNSHPAPPIDVARRWAIECSAATRGSRRAESCIRRSRRAFQAAASLLPGVLGAFEEWVSTSIRDSFDGGVPPLLPHRQEYPSRPRWER